MKVSDADLAVAPIAAAIGEPARTRMLFCLIDGRARTSTELAVLAGVSPSTASVHLRRLETVRLVTVAAQGRHRYYRLDRPEVAAALEALNVVAGEAGRDVEPRTPPALRIARTCYDHIAGGLGVAMFDRWIGLGWIAPPSPDGSCDLTALGRARFDAWGVDVDAAYGSRRRFAFACVDWSERRPHLAGALAAAILQRTLQKRWVVRDLDSRILRLTAAGRREFATQCGITLPDTPTT